MAATSPFARRAGAWAGEELSRPERLRIGGLAGYVGLVTLVFAQPLAGLLIHAIENDLHSHIPLVPFVAGYLLYLQRKPRVAAYRSSIGGTLIAAAIGCVAIVARVALHESLSANDGLAVTTLAYVSFVLAGGFLFLGAERMASAAFPIAFLFFMVPLPDAAVRWLEQASAVASTEAAALFFGMTGTPILRHGAVLTLPGIVLEVARECSGIRSSWVLFITGLVASRMFLTSPWRRVVLVAFVIPLGIVRNGFRILVIGLLGVHVGPHMLDSMIHHSGGPIFFVLSLVPLLFLAWWLRRQEHRQDEPA